jgi:acetylornithine deacetylase/succinyl-diaminopimelate desuccinylase-like protein
MRLRLPLLLAAIFATPVSAGLQAPDARHALERDILRELVEIDTSAEAGRSREAAEAVAARLLAAGLPKEDVLVIEAAPGVHSLVARYRGRRGGARPILLMAHMDVVGARREDWSFEPFEFRELDGYYYGRGTSDNKAGVATIVANFIRFREEGYVPGRDLIAVLTGDEETTGDSINHLVTDRRELVDAEFALNTDGGRGELRDGKAVAFRVQTAEKVYLSFALEVRDKGGHSSIPPPDNAIYRLADGLARLAAFAFPIQLNETTRLWFERVAATETSDRARLMRATADGDRQAAESLAKLEPYYNALMRTTCVATRLEGGHADNALPQLARATVNCRILPGVPPDDVEAILKKVVADERIVFSRVEQPVPSPASPLRPDLMDAIDRLVARMWPGAIVVPEMSTGATDGLYTRNAGMPTYGVGAIFDEIGDVRAHGRDERVPVASFHGAVEFWYQLLKELSS